MRSCAELVVALIVLLAVALPVQAIRIGGTTVVVPVIMHGPGKGTSQWRTDVWVTNPSNVAKTITLTYYPQSGAAVTRTLDLDIYTTVELRDIVLARFGSDNSKGILVMTTTTSSQFEARARIYNVGNPAGEFGQFVAGLGANELGTQNLLPGVTGVDGNRANVGIANFQDTPTQVYVDVKTGTNDTLKSLVLDPQPHQLLQVNDIFATWGIPPQGNVVVHVSSTTWETRVYAYASIVRNDTGDAITILPTSPNS